MKRSVVLLLCLCALLVRFGVLYVLDADIRFGDDVYYDRIAENICAGQGAIVTEGKVAHRMPGYPYFLSLIKGSCPTNACYVHCVRLVQAVVSAALVIPLCGLLVSVVSPVYAVWGGILYCVNPLTGVFPSFLLPETLFSAALLMLIFSLCMSLKTQSKWWVFAVFLIAGCGVYVKEVVVPFALFLLFAVCVFSGLKPFRKSIIIMFVAVCCALLPWVVRNYLLLDTFVPMTTNAGYTLYDSFNPRADGGTDVSVYDVSENRVSGGEIAQDRHWKKLTRRAIAENPARVITLARKKFLHFWSLVPNTAPFRTVPIMTAFICYYVPLFFCFLFGVWRVIRMRSACAFLVLSPVVFMTLLHLIIIGSLKYRMPVEPFIIIIAMCGVEYIVTIMKRQGR